jgi:hypothetical protein
LENALDGRKRCRVGAVEELDDAVVLVGEHLRRVAPIVVVRQENAHWIIGLARNAYDEIEGIKINSFGNRL